MHIEDFYEDRADGSPGPWGAPTHAVEFKTDLLLTLRAGPIPGDNDLETAVALTRLVHGELGEAQFRAVVAETLSP